MPEDGTDGPPVSEVMAQVDWARSPIGPPESWGSALRSIVSMMLNARAQIVLFWGAEFVALYNDAYAPSIGTKHPAAFGRPARESWAELWDDLEPLLEGVYRTGETFQANDREFYIERHGYGETVYFDVSYSLVPDEETGERGVLCIVTETTQRILAERAVKHSEAKLSAFVRATSDVVYSMSPDWSTLLMLEGQGVLADSVEPCVPWREEYLHPSDRELVDEAIAQAIASRSMFSLEHRIRLKNGETGWVQSRALPVTDADGAILEWFGAATDITERKAHQEHLELVVNELNHRVKNNLAMVQALALRTFQDGLDFKVAAAKFSDRIRALANATDLLTGARWAGASLCEAIERAVAGQAPSPERLIIKCDDAALTPKMALALSLAVHELCTNAIKYGSWSGPDGKVVIEARVHRLGRELALHFSWCESDGPRVEQPTTAGFGTRLIQRGLAAELNGEVEMNYHSTGFICRLEARLPALVD